MGGWIVEGASLLGKSHAIDTTPCQDFYCYESITSDWGLAVVCDGAGSYKQSSFGAMLVSESIATQLRAMWNAYNAEWCLDQTITPSDFDWKSGFFEAFKNTYDKLVKFSDVQKIPIQELSCTVIGFLYGPDGIYIAHVGDGRAAYTRDGKEWFAMMTPLEGDLAGSTVFLSQDIWFTRPEEYFEFRHIQGPIQGFVAMSDGCENASFITRSWDTDKQQYKVCNDPFSGFLNPCLQLLYDMEGQMLTPDQRKARWVGVLDSGTEVLQKEQDDKTLIMGGYAD